MNESDGDDIVEVPVRKPTATPIGFKRRRIIRQSIETDTTSETNKPHHEGACGKIKRIILKNFLCHEHLDYTPNENINLIQGRNGSGKSSIVAATIAGLGGASRMTDRGNLKNLIMWNKPHAQVEIHLNNEGASAFKPEKYGHTIVVERRILQTSSSYKLKSSSGNIISQKKEELKRMLDNFNISPDNPIVILTQERAKSFLNSTNPRDLFKFYMLSTTLQHLKDDYELLNASSEESDRINKSKKDSLEVQKNEVKVLENKVTSITSLAKKRQKLIDLRMEKKWATVCQMERKLEQEEKAKNKLEAQLANANLGLSKLKEEKESVEADKKSIEEQLYQLARTSMDENTRDLEAAVKDETQAKTVYRSRKFELMAIESEHKTRLDDANALKQKLETDLGEAHLRYEKEVLNLNERKQKLQAEFQNVQQCLETEQTHLSNLADLNEFREELNIKRAEAKAINKYLISQKDELRSLSSGRDKYLVFGPKIPQVIQLIKREINNFHHPPIGPVGSYIKVKDSQWVHICEKVLGGLMSSFLVNDHHDRTILHKILDKFYGAGERMPSLIVSKFRNQVHDVRNYEAVSPNYVSLWSILEVEDIQVANTLLDQRQVEGILLIPTSEEAGEILKDVRTVPKNCLKAYTLYGDLYHPDPSFRVYSGDGNNRSHILQASVEDRRRDIQSRIMETEKEVCDSKQQLREYEDQSKVLSQMHDEANRKIKTLKGTLCKLRSHVSDLENIYISAPPNVSELQKELEATEESLNEISKKKQDILESCNELGEKMKQANAFVETLRSKNHDLQKTGMDFESKLNDKQESLTKNKRQMRGYDQKKKEIESNLTTVDKDIKSVNKQLNDALTGLAESKSERVSTRRRIEDVEREYKSLEVAIDSQERQQGDPAETIRLYHEKKNAYASVLTEVDDQRNYVKKLKEILSVRCHKFERMKNFHAVFLKTAFSEKMKNHALMGQIEVNHNNEFLKILTLKGENSVLQSLSMMSGGERSFATVCFISALWETIYSPIRILDEFDIFMDVVLRKKAIDMLITSLVGKNQYMLVSPLDYNLKTDKVACFRVPSPERQKKRRITDA